MELVKRSWKGSWIEPIQEPAFRERELSFEEMAAAEGAGIPGEVHLKCGKHLRRRIDLKRETGSLPVKVLCYASAHGVYDLYINGQKADQRLLAPETTNYEKLIWYQTYDITPLVQGQEQICIDVFLGDGWWIGRLGMAGLSCNYGDKLGFIMDLELTGPDGKTHTIGSDERFKSCDSFIRYSDLYIGEMQDGRAFDFIDADQGCLNIENDEESGDAADWQPCLLASYGTEQLAEQELAGICVVEEVPCTGYVENPRGELVADFGRVLAGTVKIRVQAEPGTEITLEHGEVLDKEGNYLNNIKGLYKDQKTRYICRGGQQCFVPHFTYQGFRYVRISGIDQKDILELKAQVYATPFEKLGSFETDHPLINGLQQAIEHSTISNMISVPTDCPQREKLGWTGDISIFTPTGAFLYDLRDFLKSWLLQVRLDQTPDGEIPVVVPNHPSQDAMQRGMSGGTNSSAAWSDCCIFMPLALYRIYGDLSFLEDNYDTMIRWLEYVEGQEKEYLWNGRFHFGDWLVPSLREEPDGVMKGVFATSDIIGSCYYLLAVSAMAKVCDILEKVSEACFWRKRAEQIGRAIREAYVYDDGRVGVHAAAWNDTYRKHLAQNEPSADGTAPDEDLQLQGLYVVMLETGAVTDSGIREQMLQRLVSMIEKSGYTLDCGFSSIGFLLDVLYENGYPEVAYKLLSSEKAPSWLYMIRNGATTIWENWRAIKEDGTVTDSSYNHYAYGCVGDFMYRHIGGIEALEPGFRKVRIAPDLQCGIRHSKCERKLPGKEDQKICVEWELEDDDIHGRIQISVPQDGTAVLELPDVTQTLEPGEYDLKF